MNRRWFGLVVGVLVIAGVGAVGQEGVKGNGERLKQLEQELADLLPKLEAQEKQAEALRRKIDALRGEIAARKQKPGEGPIASPSQLVEGLPDGARPRTTGDTVRINRANDWFKANSFGKQVQWDQAIGTVKLQREADGRYQANLHADEKKNRHMLHGVEWQVMVGRPYGDAIELTGIDELTAERLVGLEGKSVKVSATVDAAYFTEGTAALQIIANDFTVGNVKTGLALALEVIKSRDPKVQKAAALTLATYGEKAKAALPDLLPMLKDKDEEVKEAALTAISVIDPGNKQIENLVPARASVNGKYTKLLMRLHIPGDRQSYGDFGDVGHYPLYPEYRGFKNVPAGHWVYVAPNWYIWGEMKK